jgi:hypothetical protein
MQRRTHGEGTLLWNVLSVPTKLSIAVEILTRDAKLHGVSGDQALINIGGSVQQPAVDNFVRLTRDVPELGLTRGQVGAVKAVWCQPLAAFEVEFRCSGESFPTRALLLKDAIHVVDVALKPTPG